MTTRKQIIKEIILKRQGFFSLDQIVEETHLPRSISREILDLLASESLILKIKKNTSGGSPGMFRVCQSEEGEKIAANRMWKVIRYKGRFNLSDLIKLANVKRETARSFLKSLRRAGLIVPSKPTGQGVYWTLVKDPGPRRPYVGGSDKKTIGRPCTM